jgi:hypothetical protein
MASKTLLGSDLRFGIVIVLRIADSSEQYRIRRLAQVKSPGGRETGAVNGGGTYKPFTEINFMSEFLSTALTAFTA